MDDVHGVGTRLLLDHHAHAPLPVGAFVHRGLFERVADLGHVGEHHRAPPGIGNHDLAHLVTQLEFAVGLDVERVVADVDRTARDVDVLGGDDLPQLLDGQIVGFELGRVDIDLHLALGGAHDRHGTHAVDTVQDVDEFIVEDLLQGRVALVGRHGKHDHGDHRGRELEDRRIIDVVGQLRLAAAHHVTDLVGALGQVGSVLEFDNDHRHVVLRLGGQFLEVAHRIEVILQDTRDVGLDIRSVGTGIEGDDRYLGNFDFGVLVYRKVHQREEPEDHHADEHEHRGDRFPNRAFVYFHMFRGVLFLFDFHFGTVVEF